MVPSSFTVSLEEWLPGQPPDGASAPMFLVRHDGDYWCPVVVRARESFVGRLVDRAATDEDDGVERATQALLRWSVRRIEENSLSGQYLLDAATTEHQTIVVSEEDERVIEALLDDKTCRYQVTSDAEMWCSAATSDDETTVGSKGLRLLAPTSMPICRRCALPASDYACDHLTHAGVEGHRYLDGSWDRLLVRALCEQGRPEVANPEQCRADGHKCWVRTLPVSTDEHAAPVSPMGLVEAFDHLDAVWRLAFDRRPLLRLSRASSVAGMAMPCETRTDFAERVTDLADLLATLNVDDADIPEGTPTDRLTGSLNRLEAALSGRLDEESLLRARDSISTLRTVSTIRNGFGHSGAAKKLPTAFGALGISYPPSSWPDAWDQVRSRTAAALIRIREELTPAAGLV